MDLNDNVILLELPSGSVKRKGMPCSISHDNLSALIMGVMRNLGHKKGVKRLRNCGL